jgi:P63C domain
MRVARARRDEQVLTFLPEQVIIGGMTELTSEAAKKLSKLGAAKGGVARANVLTPEERREIAKNAIATRWAKYKEASFPPEPEPKESPHSEGVTLPFSMFRGTVRIGDMDIECHVLNDERRVFTQREVVKVLSHGREGGNLARYLERNPLFTNQFSAGPTVDFKIPGSPTIGNGYEAILLIEICELYLEARRQKLLKPSQQKLAIQSEIILRSCAKVGIIALIDEATGFQEVRKKRALQIKLQAFIAEEMQVWAQMFPPEFWFELARLEGIHYSPRNRPLRWGKYVMAFVYDAIDKDMGKALRTINPDPHYKQNDHQLLTDFGRQQVHDQINKVVTIMKLCEDMKDFRAKFDRVFKKTALQMSFTDIWESQG